VRKREIDSNRIFFLNHFDIVLFQLLSGMVPRENQGHRPVSTLFGGNVLASKFLPSGLMTFYVDIEHTGASTQFYDKFNYRYYIADIMKYLWTLPAYHHSITEESKCECLFSLLLADNLTNLLLIGILRNSCVLSIC